MISSAQSRAARGLLAWTQVDLATAAGIGLSTVRYFETGLREISPEMAKQIEKTLERAGVVFIAENGGGAGVRLKTRRKP